jgi:hypothetical protein
MLIEKGPDKAALHNRSACNTAVICACSSTSNRKGEAAGASGGGKYADIEELRKVCEFFHMDVRDSSVVRAVGPNRYQTFAKPLIASRSHRLQRFRVFKPKQLWFQHCLSCRSPPLNHSLKPRGFSLVSHRLFFQLEAPRLRHLY